MATISQLLRNASHKILDRSFDLILSWYEVTKFAPTNPHL